MKSYVAIEKIQALEARVQALEKIEERRRKRKIISIVIKVIFYLIMLLIVYKMYTYVKPYFEQLTHINNLTSSFNNGSGVDLNQYLEELQNLFNY